MLANLVAVVVERVVVNTRHLGVERVVVGAVGDGADGAISRRPTKAFDGGFDGFVVQRAAESGIAGGLGNSESDEPTDFAKVAEVGEETPVAGGVSGGEFGQGLGGNEEHGIGDAAGFADEDAKTNAREDEDVIALANDVALTVEGDGLERRTSGDEGPSVGMKESVRGGALGLAGGVAEGKNDGPWAPFSHGADNGGGEIARLARGADENRRTDRADDGFEADGNRSGNAEGGEVGFEQSDVAFVGFEVGPEFGDQAGRVEEDLALTDLGVREALGEQSGTEEPSDAHAGGAGTGKKEALVAEGLAGEPQGGKDAGEGDRGGALDIVVKRGKTARVALKEAEGVCLLEILPLKQGTRKNVFDRLNEFLDELVVFSAAEAGSAIAQIERVGKQSGIVGPDVEADGEAKRGVDARTGRVEDEFPDGDGHPTGALVAQPENAFVVGDNDKADITLSEIAEALGDLAAIIGAQEKTAGPAVDMAVLLAGEANGGGVNDGGQALEVLGEQAVEENFVAVKEGSEADVLLERIGLGEDVLQFHGDLLLDGLDGWRQHAFDAETFAFSERKGSVFVADRVAEHLLAPGPFEREFRIVGHRKAPLAVALSVSTDGDHAAPASKARIKGLLSNANS